MVAPIDVVTIFTRFLHDEGCADRFYERLNRNKKVRESISDFVLRELTKTENLTVLVRNAFAWSDEFKYWLDISRLWENRAISLLMNSTKHDEDIKNEMLNMSYPGDNTGPLTSREALNQAYMLSSGLPGFERVKAATSFKVQYDIPHNIYRVTFSMSCEYYHTVSFTPAVSNSRPAKSYKSIW